MSERLLVIDPNAEVERQIDAFFAPAFSRIPEEHHKLLEDLERNMISAVKSALRHHATEPVPPDPARWPWSTGSRLDEFLTPAQRAELREVRKRHKD
jgi:hypothetical protein